MGGTTDYRAEQASVQRHDVHLPLPNAAPRIMVTLKPYSLPKAFGAALLPAANQSCRIPLRTSCRCLPACARLGLSSLAAATIGPGSPLRSAPNSDMCLLQL